MNNLFLHIISIWLCTVVFGGSLVAQNDTSQHFPNYFSSSSNEENFDEPWRWSYFTTESGLPSNNVMFTTEASYSTPWVNTTEGFAWYDGFEWKKITPPNDTLSSRPWNISKGDSNSLNFMNSHSLYRVTDHGIKKVGDLPSAEVWSIGNDSFVVRIKSLVYLYTQNTLSPLNHEKIPALEKVVNIWQSRSGTIWAKTLNGIYCLDHGKWKQKKGFSGKSFRGMGSKYFAENTKGEGIVWIPLPFEERGLWEWDEKTPLHRNLQEKPDNILTLDIDEQGNILIFYESGDIRYRHNGKWKSLEFLKSKLHEVTYVQFGKNGNVWFSTKNGLYLYRSPIPWWSLHKYPSPDLRNTINEILITKDSSLWLATGDGVEIYQPNGMVQHINTIKGVPLYGVTGIAEDSAGLIWISSGSSFTGAFCWNGKAWTHIPITYDSSEVFIHKIRNGKNGNLWFLGIGKDLQEVQPKQPGAFVFHHNQFYNVNTQEGLLSGRVYDMAESNNGILWFATANGLSRWVPKKSSIAVVSPNSDNGTWTYWTTANGLTGNYVYSLSLDSANNIWFAHKAFFSKLGRMDTLNKLTYFSTDQRLPSNFITGLSTDINGVLWVATDNGLAYNFANDYFFPYDHYVGLPSVSFQCIFSTPSFCYAGTRGKGLIILSTAPFSDYSVHLVVNEPHIQDQDVYLSWKTLSFMGSIPPSEIPTAYVFEGKWYPASMKHDITLNNLNPGGYSFGIWVSSGIGISTYTLQFTVPPPVYQRPYVLYPTLALSVGILSLLSTLLWRKRMYDISLRESEAKFRSVATTSASAIFVFDEDKLLFFNPAAQKLTGYSPDELKSKTFLDIIHPDSKETIKEYFSMWLQKTSVPRRFECNIITASQHERWLDVSAARIRFGGTISIIASTFDITERKEAEEALRVSEERYRIITELVSDYAYLDSVNEDGTINILWITDSYFRLTGYTAEETRAPDFLQRFIFHEDFLETISFMTELIKGTPQGHDGRIVTKDGRVLWMHNEARPIWNEDHTRVAYIYGSAHEITRQKQDEEQMKLLAKDLADTERRERKRLATFLHDVIAQKLVLSKIKLDSMQRFMTDEDVVNRFKEVYSLVNQSINDTRSATFQLFPPILFERGLVAAIEWLIQNAGNQHATDFIFEHETIHGKLSEEIETILFNAARESLSNVTKYAQAKKVHVTLSNDANQILLIIQDDGVGFDVQQVKEQPRQHSGFGLFNIQQQLLSCSGTMEIQSKPGEGTRLIFMIPIKQ